MSAAPGAMPADPAPHGGDLREAGSLRSIVQHTNHRWLGWLLLFVFLDAAAPPVLAVALAAVTDGARDHQDGKTLFAALVAAAAAAVALSAERVHTNQQNRIVRVAGAQLSATMLSRAACSPTIEHLDHAADADRIRIVAGSGRYVVDQALAPVHLLAATLQIVLFTCLLAVVRLPLLLVPVAGVVSVVLTRRAERSAATGVRVELGAVLARIPVVLAYGGALWLIALDAARGQRSPGAVVLVALATVGLARALPRGASAARDVVGGRRAVDQLRWFCDVVPVPGAVSNARRVPRAIVSGIDFVDVSVGSPGSEVAALRHVSCHMPAGATVAVVGGPRSGRSTFVEVALGLRVPTGGMVTVDGVDVSDMDPAGWRSRTSWCGHGSVPLESSARRVVTAGLPDLEDAAVVDANHRGGAEPGSWPHGIATRLGTRSGDGIELCEADWQRVAIARALARPDPLLLVFDEAVSDSDPAAERELYRRVSGRERPAGGIVLLVPRAVEAALDVDLVVVLDDGHVVECGAPGALVAASGRYAHLLREQRLSSYP